MASSLVRTHNREMDSQPTNTGMQVFQSIPAMLFIDESGQFRTPQEGEPPEVGVVAGFGLPDTQSHRERLAALVARLRQIVHGADNRGLPIKGRMLTQECWERVGAEMRNGWFFGHLPMRYGLGDMQPVQGALGALALAVDIKRADLRGGKRLDARLDFLRQQCTSATHRHPVYLMLLINFYLKVGQWFRAQGLVPQLRVWLDRKLLTTDRELVGFLGRLGIWTTYPEIYSNRLGGMLGVDPQADMACNVSGDEHHDGLIVADAVAYASGRLSRGDDKDGFFRRALGAMSTSPTTPLS